MATMYDAPMQDFTGENSMDADMLPSTAAEADWFHAESMMDDGDTLGHVEDEVEMANEEVQEFEMTDAGDAEIFEYQEEFAEPQDQEIPDASRVASPLPGAPQYDVHDRTTTMAALNYPDSLGNDPAVATEVISHESNNDVGGSATRLSPDIRNVSVAEDSHNESTSVKSLEGSEVLKDAPDRDITATEVAQPPQDTQSAVDSGHSPSQPEGDISVNTIPEESHIELKEDVGEAETDLHGKANTTIQAGHNENVVSHDATHSDIEKKSEEHIDNGGNVQNVEASQRGDGVENEGVEEVRDDDLDSSTDQPPCVLLSFTFDGSSYALFELPSDQFLSSANIATDPSQEASHNDRSLEATKTTLSKNRMTLLFESRSGLYYGPVSSLFEALRNDTATNVEGRFDQNIELVLFAPDLDLTLPEDNIHAREVSLSDLTILHTGCDLPGHLTLRLDTNAPRFGTRYKAIRDEVFRVISQQETDDQQDLPPSTVDDTHEESEEKTAANLPKEPAGPEAVRPSVQPAATVLVHTKDLEHEAQTGKGSAEHISDDTQEQKAQGISEQECEEAETEQHEDDTEYYGDGDDVADVQHTNVEGSLEAEEDEGADAEGIQEGNENYVEEETIYDGEENELDEEPGDHQIDLTAEYDDAEENDEFADAPSPLITDLTEQEALAPSPNPQENTQSALTTHKSTPSITDDFTAESQHENDGKSSGDRTIDGSSLDDEDKPSAPTPSVKKGSKRSFDEHEAEQHQPQHESTSGDTGDTKRLKVA